MRPAKLAILRIMFYLLGMILGSPALLPGQDKQLVPQTGEGKKTALVIGNSAYPLGKLKNPVNDAQDMRTSLRSKGFVVQDCCDNVGLKELTNAINKWTATLHSGDIAVFYYSGHGLRVGSIDYIEPVDFSADSEADVPFVGYAVDRLADKMQERGTRANLIFLDACRNNPYVVAKDSATGLAGVTAGVGTLIMFAAAQGKTASDNDSGRNSLFTSVLLQEFNRPQVALRTLEYRVRDKVYELSNKTQIPYSSDGLIGELVLGVQGTAEATTAGNSASATTPDSGRNSPTERTLRENEHIRYLNAQIARAKDLAKAGNYDEAISILKALTVSDPREDLIWAYLGEYYGKAKRPEESIGAYEQAVSIAPYNAAYHQNLGNLYAAMNPPQVDKAIAEYEKAVQADPSSAAVSYFNEGAVFTNNGRTDEAITAFDKAIQLDPARADTYYWKGVALVGKARMERNKMVVSPGTVEAFRKYLELQPDGKYAKQAKDMLASIQ